MKAKLKNAWRSWTIWFNSIIGSVMTLLPVAQDSFPQIQAYIPPHVYQWVMGIIVVGNIILRFKTTLDLANKG